VTAFLRAFLFCNGCDNPFDFSTVPAARNVSGARRDAKRRGWSRTRDGRDWCDGCTTDRTADEVAALRAAEDGGR
jgi:hypothetical protein